MLHLRFTNRCPLCGTRRQSETSGFGTFDYLVSNLLLPSRLVWAHCVVYLTFLCLSSSLQSLLIFNFTIIRIYDASERVFTCALKGATWHVSTCSCVMPRGARGGNCAYVAGCWAGEDVRNGRTVLWAVFSSLVLVRFLRGFCSAAYGSDQAEEVSVCFAWNIRGVSWCGAGHLLADYGPLVFVGWAFQV